MIALSSSVDWNMFTDKQAPGHRSPTNQDLSVSPVTSLAALKSQDLFVVYTFVGNPFKSG